MERTGIESLPPNEARNALGEQSLGIGRDRLVAVGDQTENRLNRLEVRDDGREFCTNGSTASLGGKR
jgi:hypothetical protein